MYFKQSRNKFGAKRVEEAGYSFASQGERDCFRMLKQLEAAGEIKIIKCQDRISLTPPPHRIEYIADFKIWDEKLSENVWIEFKGVETPTWRLKKKLWAHYGPGRLRVYKGKYERINMIEEIVPIQYLQKQK